MISSLQQCCLEGTYVHIPVNMADPQTPHQDLHSEQGALRGEHPGRSRNPVIKVADLAWLEFEKPDLDRAEVFARDFGFAVAARTEGKFCGCAACLRAHPAWSSGGACVPVHRAGVPRGRAGRPGPAGPRHRQYRPAHRRTGRWAVGRPARLPRACRSGSCTVPSSFPRCPAGAADPQLRYRSPSYERHPAPAP